MTIVNNQCWKYTILLTAHQYKTRVLLWAQCVVYLLRDENNIYYYKTINILSMGPSPWQLCTGHHSVTPTRHVYTSTVSTPVREVHFVSFKTLRYNQIDQCSHVDSKKECHEYMTTPLSPHVYKYRVGGLTIDEWYGLPAKKFKKCWMTHTCM